MEEDEFTPAETERQDIVDNAIANLISELIPIDCPFDWDIELISIIRDAVQEVLVDKMHAMTEQEFYPYREIEPADPRFPKETIFLSEEQLERAIEEAMNGLDMEDLCVVAGDLLGGTCWVKTDGDGYGFIPNDMYGGVFDYLKKKEK